jgi:hypothetical protein
VGCRSAVHPPSTLGGKLGATPGVYHQPTFENCTLVEPCLPAVQQPVAAAGPRRGPPLNRSDGADAARRAVRRLRPVPQWAGIQDDLVDEKYKKSNDF